MLTVDWASSSDAGNEVRMENFVENPLWQQPIGGPEIYFH